MLAFLVLWAGASAIDSSLTFSFFKQQTIFRKNDDVCRMCYGEYDCLTLDKTRCEYNAETAAIFYDGDRQEGQESSNIAIKTQVDTLLNDLTLQESIMEEYEECVPIISSYTNCDRENICSGCRTCDCTLEGKWNCSLVQRCRPAKTEIDHRVLVSVMETLKSDLKPFRAKREAYYEKSTLQTDNFEELMNWFYEETAPEHNETFKKIAHIKEPSIKTKRDSENAPTIIALDDVLNVIGLETNDSSTLTPNHIDSPDSSKDIDDFLQMLALEEGKETKSPSLDATTKVIVNFTNDNNKIDTNTVALDTDNLNKKDTNDILNKEILLEKDFNLMDNLGFINLMNVMKRDVNQVNKTVDSTTVQTKNMSLNLEDKPVTVRNIDIGGNNITNAVKLKNIYAKNMTYSEKVLQNEVLNALLLLIKNKHKEIEQLTKIKESVITFMNNYNFNSTIQYKSKLESNQGKSSHLIFKSEENLNKYGNFRRHYSNNNADLVETYSKKLKMDINEVVRDILGIRKHQKSKVLSKELKLLLQAITYFLKKSSVTSTEKKSNNTSFIGKVKNFRRQFSPTNIDTNLNPVLKAVLIMLEVIDRDMPASNALDPLSPKAKKVFKRIVSRNYVDDFGYKVKGHNNFTTDLNNMGLNWQELTLRIVNCAPADRLHNMKLLYLILSNDIILLKDASATTDFFHSRRMSFGNDLERKALIYRINTDLSRVDNIIRHYKKENKVTNVKKRKQKQSLLKKIKTLWKTSKDDLINILRKRSKPHVVKEMERKKAEEEKTHSFLEVVQKWQDNLDIMPFRNKRSIREYTKLKNRMKNIIPHYLRGKLHPALSAKGIGVRKKPITYKMRPQSTVHPAAKIAQTIATSKPKAVKLNKMKQKH
ncbi:uncharacterized protein [Choristoneura fumiferana]|uniref:uncharacterized protein n=1 Tax=Choristoneura fumiferana TaxID=7141 RepID=UPI003D15BE36